MSDAPDAIRDASADAAAPFDRGRDASGRARTNIISEVPTTGGDAFDMPAREQVPVSDEVLARRLAEELNTTGRKRRAPEPLFVPATPWGPGGKGKSRAKGQTPKPSTKTRARRKPPSRCQKKKQKPPARPRRVADAKEDERPFDKSEEDFGDDDASDPTPNNPSETHASDSDDSDDSDDEKPLCDVDWQTRVPEKELPPPPGFVAGDLVWARLSSKKSQPSTQNNNTSANATNATNGSLSPTRDNDDGSFDADDPSALWWPGRVWKLRNCSQIERLWRSRGAPPSTPMALVRCFGDGSFAWAGADTLVPFFVHEHERLDAYGQLVCKIPRVGDAEVSRERLASPEGREGTGTSVRDSDARNAFRARERHDAFSARLLAIATRRSAPKKKGKHGLRVVASVARKALEETEEACMGAWVPTWSASEGEEESGEEDSGDEGTGVTNGNGRRKRAFALGAPVDPRHAARVYEPREDGEKDGLTPDWVIDAGCRVFDLNLPTIEEPIIRGLLDPCTNSKRRPNIPAEKTYDKADDGLKQENSWKGFHVILNPSYESSVQWRFINRAINEVEWGFCPGILLVCRNSTDTSYFQRLLPFPRVFLRRDAVMFKDYDHTPIGFGIAVFCLVSPVVPKTTKLAVYRRFFDEFHHAGEFNVPFDAAFMEEAAFERLTDRLHVAAATRFRDSWVACDKCDRWREIPPTQSLAQIGASATWRCAFAHPNQGCAAPLTDRELKAFSVAAKGHALALRAEKRGTDIQNGAAEAETAAPALPGAPDPRTPGAASAPDARASDAEDGFAGASGWRKVEKTEDDTRDAGESDAETETETETTETQTERESGAPIPNATPTERRPTDPPTRSPPVGGDPVGGDPTEPLWLDEVSLRGGRKRFALGPRSSAPVRPRADARRERERRERRAARRDGDGLDGLRLSLSAAEDARLTDFERERLANVRRNRAKLASMFGRRKRKTAGAKLAEDGGAEDPRALADRLERAAAEASSALAVATRALKEADAACAKATAASEPSIARARRAAAAAAVAEKEARASESAALDARAEALAARAVVERLAVLADHAEARCDAAAQAAG